MNNVNMAVSLLCEAKNADSLNLELAGETVRERSQSSVFKGM